MKKTEIKKLVKELTSTVLEELEGENLKPEELADVLDAVSSNLYDAAWDVSAKD